MQIYPKLVLVHGLKYSGKSTIADHLINQYGYERVKMADPLKNMVRSLLKDAGIAPDLIEDRVEGNLKEEPIPELGGTSARKLMMTLGDEWRNMHGHMLWANIAAARVVKHLEEGSRVVIDDIRYPFEIERMSAFNPYKLVVTRGNMHFEPYGEDRHPGERPMSTDLFDAHLANDFSEKSALWNNVDSVFFAYSTFRAEIGRLESEMCHNAVTLAA